MKFCLNFRTVLASSACAIIFLPAPATAQSQTESAEPAPVANSAVMADIVVTARRTAENIQSTPMSVTAFGGGVLRQVSISDIHGPFDRKSDRHGKHGSIQVERYGRGI